MDQNVLIFSAKLCSVILQNFTSLIFSKVTPVPFSLLVGASRSSVLNKQVDRVGCYVFLNVAFM